MNAEAPQGPEVLRIVARCTDQRIAHKLVRAGANAVVSPNMIGGLRLVSELIRPDAVTFLDTMLRDKEKRLRIEEVDLAAGAKAIGRTIGALFSSTASSEGPDSC